MPSFFSPKKKKSSVSNTTNPTSPSASEPASPSPSASPLPSPEKDKDKAKKSKGYFARERDRDARPRVNKSARRLSETHPLNLPPDEIRRLSLLAAMSGAPENGAGVEAMETTPAPEENVAAVNGVNGEQSGEEGPVPPPHRTPTPQPEVDAEACKAAGNKFYKAGQYERAIEEYSKGLSWQVWKIWV